MSEWKEQWEEQKKMLEEEDLLRIEGNNQFVNDVIGQFKDGNILSEKQVDALKSNRDKIIEIFGSLDEWEEEMERYKNALELIDWMMRNLTLWEKHADILSSMREHAATSRFKPGLSDKQIELVKDLKDHYSKQIMENYIGKPLRDDE